MTYTVIYADTVAEHDIPALPKSVREKIHKAIIARLTTYPHHYGKPLGHSLAGNRRLRVGDYRIIYCVDEKKRIVFINAIGHRKDIYDQ